MLFAFFREFLKMIRIVDRCFIKSCSSEINCLRKNLMSFILLPAYEATGAFSVQKTHHSIYKNCTIAN